MPIDLVALDEKIRKLQLIRQLAADPDVLSLLNDIVSANGHGAGAVIQKPQKPLVERKGVRYDVLKYVVDPSAVPLEGWKTARQIAEKMEEKNYKFKSQDHMSTVRESLRELERERLVERAGTDPEDGATLWRKTV
jgi:hypothetical protein